MDKISNNAAFSLNLNEFKTRIGEMKANGQKPSETFAGFDGVSLSGNLTSFSKTSESALKDVNSQISKFGDSTNIEIGKSLKGKTDTSKLTSAGGHAITSGNDLGRAIDTIKNDSDIQGLLGLDLQGQEAAVDAEATAIEGEVSADVSGLEENAQEEVTGEEETAGEARDTADQAVSDRDTQLAAADQKITDCQTALDDKTAQATQARINADEANGIAEGLKTNADNLKNNLPDKNDPHYNEMLGKWKDADNAARIQKEKAEDLEEKAVEAEKAQENAAKALQDAKDERVKIDAKTSENVKDTEAIADNAENSLKATKTAANEAVKQAKADQKEVISDAKTASADAKKALKSAQTMQQQAQVLLNQANGYQGLADTTVDRGNRAMTIADAINNAPATSAPTKKGESKMKAFGQFITEHGNDIKSGIDEAVKALGGLFGAIDDDKKASNDSSGSDKSTTTNTTVVQEKVGGTQAKIGGNKTTAASDTAATAATTATTGTSATAQSANTSETEETADEVNLSDSKAEYLKNQAQLTKEINTKGFGDAKAAQDSLMDFVNDSITALSNNPSASNIADAEYALTQANIALKPGRNNAKWQGEMKGPVAELKAALDSAKSGSSSGASSTSHTASASSTNKTETIVDTSTSGVESKYGKYQNVYEGVLSSLKGQAKNDDQAKAAEQTFEKLVDNAVESYKNKHDGQEPEAGTMNDILGKAAMNAGLSSGYSNVNIRIVG